MEGGISRDVPVSSRYGKKFGWADHNLCNCHYSVNGTFRFRTALGLQLVLGGMGSGLGLGNIPPVHVRRWM